MLWLIRCYTLPPCTRILAVQNSSQFKKMQVLHACLTFAETGVQKEGGTFYDVETRYSPLNWWIPRERVSPALPGEGCLSAVCQVCHVLAAFPPLRVPSLRTFLHSQTSFWRCANIAATRLLYAILLVGHLSKLRCLTANIEWKEPRFDRNYRDNVAVAITRDRNLSKLCLPCTQSNNENVTVRDHLDSGIKPYIVTACTVTHTFVRIS